MKPHYVVIAGRPVEINPKRVQEARQRFGRPFCHEPGSTWTPRQTPLLLEWLAGRKKAA